ncbi:hypothetical protein J1605_021660 [Eschrichtius robustus]|uniref:EARP and GARP complex-interacting protein 1 n=1 Tax=Eschrichtius robustus TaxID=9764 RepID=A0AB34HAY1_ESCRO|nr:hypothetical protein J1605_021660 [Eschrichtius robustus]
MVPCRNQEPPQDSVIATYEEHEDSVYAVDWSSADPWLFASLSYDGRLVINRVPRALKKKADGPPVLCPGPDLPALGPWPGGAPALSVTRGLLPALGPVPGRGAPLGPAGPGPRPRAWCPSGAYRPWAPSPGVVPQWGLPALGPVPGRGAPVGPAGPGPRPRAWCPSGSCRPWAPSPGVVPHWVLPALGPVPGRGAPVGPAPLRRWHPHHLEVTRVFPGHPARLPVETPRCQVILKLRARDSPLFLLPWVQGSVLGVASPAQVSRLYRVGCQA